MRCCKTDESFGAFIWHCLIKIDLRVDLRAVNLTACPTPALFVKSKPLRRLSFSL